MTIKTELLSKVDKVNTLYSQSPIAKGLIDGGLSFIPFLGTAISSALDTRASQMYEKNTKLFIEEVKRLLDNLNEEKVDKRFLESDEFVSLLIEILTKNAQAHEEEKIRLYSRLFVNANLNGKSITPYKEGFIQIIDQLSTTHILILAFIYEKCLAFTNEDRDRKLDRVTVTQIANEINITESTAQTYCVQMIRYNLLFDWLLGRWGYKPEQPGAYVITDYGREFAAFLKLEDQG